jgi:hypothetical protein
MIGVIPMVEGEGHLGPSDPRRGDKCVNNIHLLLSDAALPRGTLLMVKMKQNYTLKTPSTTLVSKEE